MRKLLLVLLVMLAVRMAGRAVRQNAEVMAALWLLLGLTATASTAGTAKSRSTEDRLNGLIPVVFPNTGGTITGSVTVNGNHTIGGNLSGSGGTLAVSGNQSVSGAFTTTSTITSHGSVNVDNSITAGGNGSISGSLTVGGNHSVSGQVNANTLSISGAATTSGFTSHGGVTADGNIHAGGTISGSNFSGSFAGGQGGVSTVSAAPASYNQAAMTAYASAINGIIARISAAGVT